MSSQVCIRLDNTCTVKQGHCCATKKRNFALNKGGNVVLRRTTSRLSSCQVYLGFSFTLCCYEFQNQINNLTPQLCKILFEPSKVHIFSNFTNACMLYSFEFSTESLQSTTLLYEIGFFIG